MGASGDEHLFLFCSCSVLVVMAAEDSMAAVQAASAKKADDGLDVFQQAYLDMLTALSGWRVAQDCEAQVAHWVIEGIASYAGLVEARERTRVAHKAYASARIRYNRLSALAVAGAGLRAYRRDYQRHDRLYDRYDRRGGV